MATKLSENMSKLIHRMSRKRRWNHLATFDVYDPINDKWNTTKNMPVPIGYQSSAVIDNRIYVIGGEPFDAHDGHYDILWEYDPFAQSNSVSAKDKLTST